MKSDDLKCPNCSENISSHEIVPPVEMKMINGKLVGIVKYICKEKLISTKPKTFKEE